MIFDTDILVWCLRNNSSALAFVSSAHEREISQATWLELVAGVRNKRELSAAKSLLADCNFHVLPLTEAIGLRAGVLMEEHALKDGLDTVDSIIAATALVSGLPIATANYKHYKMLHVDLHIFKPSES